MKVALVGGQSFGVAVLKLLDELEHEIVTVVSKPDDKLTRVVVDDWGLGWCHPLDLDSSVTQGIDLIVAAHNHIYIRQSVLDAANYGGISYHPSLLPRHRGKDAIRWTIHMRDPIAGGTVYWLDKRVDGGPVAAQDWCFVDPSWTASDLWRERLFGMGVELIRKTVTDVSEGRIIKEPQDERFASWEPSWERPPLRTTVTESQTEPGGASAPSRISSPREPQLATDDGEGDLPALA